MTTPQLYIAVIHDKKFSMRLQTLNNLISKFKSGFKVEMISKHDAADLKIETIRQQVKLENPDTKTMFDALIRNMHVKQVSQVLKHKAALESFLDQETFDMMLVLEDDVLCGDNIVSELDNAIELFKKNSETTDIMFLGCPTPRAMIDSKEPIADVSKYFKLLPSCDAYLVNKESARKVLDAFTPIRYQATIQFSFISHTQGIRAKMMSPNIFVNGSKYGVYVSSVDPNNRLFMNQEYNKLVMLNSKSSYSKQEIEEVIEMTSKMPLREHPDFQYQFGLFFMRIGQTKAAKEFLDNAYKTYVSNDTIVNNESEFLINYARVFKFTQTDRDEIEAMLEKTA